MVVWPKNLEVAPIIWPLHCCIAWKNCVHCKKFCFKKRSFVDPMMYFLWNVLILYAKYVLNVKQIEPLQLLFATFNILMKEWHYRKVWCVLWREGREYVRRPELFWTWLHIHCFLSLGSTLIISKKPIF